TAARGSGRERVPGLLALRAEGVEGLLETGGGDGLTLDGGLERRLDAVEVLLELGVREVLDGDEALARRVDRGGGLLVLGVLEERHRLGDEALGGVLAAVERVARGRHGDDGGRHLGGRLGRGRGLGGRRVVARRVGRRGAGRQQEGTGERRGSGKKLTHANDCTPSRTGGARK